MAPSENERELADRERLTRMWRRYHAEQLEQALAGIHSDVMKRLMAQLEDLRSARALVDLVIACAAGHLWPQVLELPRARKACQRCLAASFRLTS